MDLATRAPDALQSADGALSRGRQKGALGAVWREGGYLGALPRDIDPTIMYSGEAVGRYLAPAMAGGAAMGMAAAALQSPFAAHISMEDGHPSIRPSPIMHALGREKALLQTMSILTPEERAAVLEMERRNAELRKRRDSYAPQETPW